MITNLFIYSYIYVFFRMQLLIMLKLLNVYEADRDIKLWCFPFCTVKIWQNDNFFLDAENGSSDVSISMSASSSILIFVAINCFLVKLPTSCKKTERERETSFHWANHLRQIYQSWFTIVFNCDYEFCRD